MSELGNPVLIKTAASAAKAAIAKKGMEKALATKDRANQAYHSQTGRKFRKAAGTAVIVTGVSYAGYKGYQAIRRNKLLKRAASDPEVRSAVDIWSSIPDGFKNSWSLFNILMPIAAIGKAYDELETAWKKTNTDRIMSIANNINKSELNVTKIAKYFKALYRIDLVTLLNKVLQNEQIDMFYNILAGGSGSVSEKVSQGLFAVALEDVRLRDEPAIEKWYQATNVRNSCKSGYVAGQVTGEERLFNEGKKSTVFVQLLAFDSSVNSNKYSQPVWAWKGAFEFLTKSEILAKYGQMRVHDVKMSLLDKYWRV